MDLKQDKRIEELERKVESLMRGQHYVAASHLNTNRLDAQSAGITGSVLVGGDLNIVGGMSLGATAWYKEQGSAPSTPSSGYGALWANTSMPMYKNDAGVAVGMCVDRIWLGARDGWPTWASPTWTAVYNNWGWYVPTDVDSYIYWNTELPPHWSGRTLYVRSHWLADSTDVGNVFEVLGGIVLTDGGVGNPAATFTAQAYTPAPGQYYYRIKEFAPAQTVPVSTSFRGLQWCWWRYGTHASDTYTGAVVLVGIELIVV